MKAERKQSDEAQEMDQMICAIVLFGRARACEIANERRLKYNA